MNLFYSVSICFSHAIMTCTFLPVGLAAIRAQNFHSRIMADPGRNQPSMAAVSGAHEQDPKHTQIARLDNQSPDSVQPAQQTSVAAALDPAPLQETPATAAPDRRVSQRKRRQPQRLGAPTTAENLPLRATMQQAAAQPLHCDIRYACFHGPNVSTIPRENVVDSNGCEKCESDFWVLRYNILVPLLVCSPQT